MAKFGKKTPILLLASACFSFATSELSAQGPPPERIFDYMDRNKNGTLDPEEMQRMPGTYREVWSKHVNLSKPLSKDKFLQYAPKIFEESRRRREEEYRRRKEDEKRRESDRDRGRGNDDRSRESSKPSTTRQRRQPIRITVDMPEKYTENDTNVDGQVSMKEWRETNRGTLSEFAAVDVNGDGFLTPAELVQAENPKPESSASQPTVSSRPTFASSRSSPVMSKKEYKAANKALKKEVSVSDNSAGAKEGAYYFGLMDRNRDGNIDANEWSRSKRIRPFFEQAGADLKNPMPKDDFVRIYVSSGAVKNR